MCNCKQLIIKEHDDNPLFQVLYCEKHDANFDGFGVSIDPIERMIIHE